MQSKDCKLNLLPLEVKGVRGLGKHLPVISLYERFTEKIETYRNSHYGCPNLFFEYHKTRTLVISPRIENDLLVVKDHGNTVFVNPSRKRSRRKHRSL